MVGTDYYDKMAIMDELILKLANGYLQILAWIGSGLPTREMVKEAYDLKGKFAGILQSYSKTDLEGLELARYVFQRLQRQTP